MFPAPFIVVLVASMCMLQKLQLAQAVSTAASVGFHAGATAGGAAGAAVGVGMARPSLVPLVISLPLRVMNALFYYLLGGHTAEQRMRVLELATSNTSEAPK